MPQGRLGKGGQVFRRIQSSPQMSVSAHRFLRMADHRQSMWLTTVLPVPLHVNSLASIRSGRIWCWSRRLTAGAIGRFKSSYSRMGFRAAVLCLLWRRMTGADYGRHGGRPLHRIRTCSSSPLKKSSGALGTRVFRCSTAATGGGRYFFNTLLEERGHAPAAMDSGWRGSLWLCDSRGGASPLRASLRDFGEGGGDWVPASIAGLFHSCRMPT